MIVIRKDTVWGPGVKTLTDNIQIAPGATLTILPGAEIEGQSFFKIEAYGNLVANGTKQKPILLNGVHVGLSDNYKISGSIEVSYAQVSRGSVASGKTGTNGSAHISNSVFYNMENYISAIESVKQSSVLNNVFMNSAGVSLGGGANADIGYNIFDGYTKIPTTTIGLAYGPAISSSAPEDINASTHNNAFLETGRLTIDLGQYDYFTSINDYFGSTDKNIIQRMVYDKNDDISYSNAAVIIAPAKAVSDKISKELFSFVSMDIPKDVIETARLVGSRDANLVGNKLANYLTGNAGSNTLDGGLGADTMAGGLGNDTYIIDNARDVIRENAGQGYDRVVASVSYTLSANVEMLTLSGKGAINATGNGLANHLVGNGGNNVLDGKGGVDIMEGDAGNDTYRVDHASDRVIEAVGGGRDTVVTTVSYRLAAGQEIEVLQTADANGKAALKLTGNEFGNKLVGNAGANVLDGGAGIDEMRGGAGDDTYLVDHARDLVVEAIRGGTDTVVASVSYALKGGQEIESLRLTGTAGSAGLTGNEFGQSLVGNAGANVLNGGLGNDVLTGGKGADTFVFATKLGASNVDHITDFTGADTIRLSKSIFSALAPGELKASEVKDIAKAKVDADDHILYDSRDGSLFYDADGSGKAAAVKFAVLDNKAAITHADVLVA